MARKKATRAPRPHLLNEWRRAPRRRILKVRKRNPHLLTYRVCLERAEDGTPLLVGYGHPTRGSMVGIQSILRLCFGNLRQIYAFTGWDSNKDRFVCKSWRRQPKVRTGVSVFDDPPRFRCKQVKQPPRPRRPRYAYWVPAGTWRRPDAFAGTVPLRLPALLPNV